MFKTIFSKAIQAAKVVAGVIGAKASIGQVIGSILGQLPALAQSFAEFEGADKETRIRAAWDEFDANTGLEGADIIRSLPAAQEELLFDGIKQVGLVLSLWAAGIYGPKPSIDEVLSVGSSIGSALSSSTGGLAGTETAKAAVAAAVDYENDDFSEPEKLQLALSELKIHADQPSSFLVQDQLEVLREVVLRLAAAQGA